MGPWASKAICTILGIIGLAWRTASSVKAIGKVVGACSESEVVRYEERKKRKRIDDKRFVNKVKNQELGGEVRKRKIMRDRTGPSYIKGCEKFCRGTQEEASSQLTPATPNRM